MGVSTLFFAGCKKKAEPSSAPQAPESYMNDPVFRGKLAEQRAAHLKLVRERNGAAEKLKEKLAALKAKLKTDDVAKLQAELAKDPEWAALLAECTNANAKVEANRQATLGVVRERLTTKKQEISK